MSAGIAQRLLVLALALVAVVWLGVSLRAAAAERDALDLTLAPGPIGPEELRRGQELVDRAATLSPSTLPDLFRAQLLRRAGRPREALRVLATIVRREPRNVGAWAAIAVTGARVDPVAARTARRRLRELVPLRR